MWYFWMTSKMLHFLFIQQTFSSALFLWLELKLEIETNIDKTHALGWTRESCIIIPPTSSYRCKGKAMKWLITTIVIKVHYLSVLRGIVDASSIPSSFCACLTWIRYWGAFYVESSKIMQCNMRASVGKEDACIIHRFYAEAPLYAL